MKDCFPIQPALIFKFNTTIPLHIECKSSYNGKQLSCAQAYNYFDYFDYFDATQFLELEVERIVFQGWGGPSLHSSRQAYVCISDIACQLMYVRPSVVTDVGLVVSNSEEGHPSPSSVKLVSSKLFSHFVSQSFSFSSFFLILIYQISVKF